MTPEDRADAVVAYLKNQKLSQRVLENVRGRILNEIKWAIEEEQKNTLKIRRTGARDSLQVILDCINNPEFGLSGRTEIMETIEDTIKFIDERIKNNTPLEIEKVVNTELDYGDKDRPRLSKELSE